jgi:hypothetical protein
MSWTQPQAAVTAGEQSGTTIGAQYGSNTTAGNLLIACVGASASSAGSWSAPTGWIQADNSYDSTAACALYYYPNAPSISSSSVQTFGYSGADNGMTLILMEWNGGVGTLDQHTTSTGTSSGTVATGSITPTKSGELVVAAISAAQHTVATITETTPTNSFTAVTTVATYSGASNVFRETLGAFYLAETTPAAASTSVTVNGTPQYATVIASFKTTGNTGLRQHGFPPPGKNSGHRHGAYAGAGF